MLIKLSLHARSALRFAFIPFACCGLLFGEDEIRTWTDATGKHKLKGSFVKVEDGKVYLKQESGKEMIIPLDKLSAADAKTAKELADSNPFKESDGTSPFEAAPVAPAKALPRLNPNWNNTKRLTFEGAPLDWKVDIASAPPIAPIPSPRPINTTIANKEFFEKYKSIVFAPAAKRAIVSHINAPPGKDPMTRLSMIDLAAAKSLGAATTPGSFIVHGVKPDGDQVVVATDNWAKEPAIEVWNLTKTGIVRAKSWNPVENKDDWNKEIVSGCYLDDKRVLVQGKWGKIVVWDVEKALPLMTMDGELSGRISISQDKKYLLTKKSDKLVLIDLVAMDTVASKSIPSIGAMAMSADNKTVAIVSSDKCLTFDAATGETKSEFRIPFSHGSELVWTSPTTLLAGKTLLIDLEKKIGVWNYRGIDELEVFGGYCWVYCQDGGGSRATEALLPLRLPHDAAKAAALNFVPPPIEYYLQPGDGVAIDMSGIGDGTQIQAAEQAVTKRLKELGYVVDPQSPVRLVGLVETGMAQQLAYRNFGAGFGQQEVHTFTPRVSSMKYVLGDKVIWSTGGVSGWAPTGFVNLKQGETIADKLRAAEQPNYRVFTTPLLPKEVEKRPDNATAGSSTISATGIKEDGGGRRR